jgi:hypothetical protein
MLAGVALLTTLVIAARPVKAALTGVEHDGSRATATSTAGSNVIG